MPAWLSKAFAPPRGIYAAALLGMAVALPSLFMGFFVDDYLHILTIEGKYDLASPFDLFRFAGGDPEETRHHIEEGPMPWFMWPHIELHFFRPLSSASMVLDNVLFGRNAVLYHLHSVLWYGLLVLGAGLIFRRVLSPWPAVLAAVLYALDDAHIVPGIWWSNRNALVAAAPALLGFWAHIRWREDGWKPGLPLSLAGYALGFLGAEVALGIMPFVGAFEIIWRRDAPARRFGALLPAALLSVGYLAFYKYNGYGCYGSGIYIDPISEWRDFLGFAPNRILMLTANQFLTLPIEGPIAVPSLEGPVVAASIVVLLVIGALLLLVWPRLSGSDRRALEFLLAGSVLSTLPALATFPSGRLMTIPSLASAAVLAVLLHQAWQNRQSLRLARLGVVAIVLVHVLTPALLWATVPFGLRHISQRGHEAAAAAQVDPEGIEERTLVFINPPDPFAGMYSIMLRRYDGLPRPAGWYFLSMAPYDHEVTRVDDHTLNLRVVDGEILTTIFEKLVRNKHHPLLPGEILRFRDFDVEILAVGDSGPSRMQFRFKRSLDDPKLELLEWRNSRMQHFTPPAVGETVYLERTRGLFDWDFLFPGSNSDEEK
ncbi:MAG: hypothetical protein GC168_15470 [Candidatus Hydrogenedens sp.]|nr:hypothetical protein [Candidatus Hydrogenedens sp.]